MACSLPFGGGAEEPTEEPATSEPEIMVVTATPEPEPTATDDSAAVETDLTATANRNLNIRGGPSTEYTASGTFAQGDTAPVVGKNQDGSWLLLSFPGGNTGWVSTAYTAVGDLSSVPVINVPPPSSSGGSSGGGSNPTSAPPPTATSDGGGGGGGGGGQTAPSDSNISTELNIKNGVVNESGVISYPNGDTMDQVYIKVVGFDSVTTSGDASITLTCTGDGVGNVQVFGGGGCNQTWDKFFTNDSDQYTMRVSLESGSNAYVNWTLIVSANN
jgi:hypothetical protein